MGSYICMIHIEKGGNRLKPQIGKDKAFGSKSVKSHQRELEEKITKNAIGRCMPANNAQVLTW